MNFFYLIMRLISLDTETTGLLFYNGHRIVEIGCVEIINGEITDKIFHTYINPLRKMDPGAQKITGLTDDFLNDKPLFMDVIDKLFVFLKFSHAVLIHNARFDTNFINNELRLNDHVIKDISFNFNIIDTLRLARQKHPGKKNSLNALQERYKIKGIDRSVHGALTDALLLARIYIEMTTAQKKINFSNSLDVNTRYEIVKKLNIVKANKYELEKHKSYMNYLNKKNVK